MSPFHTELFPNVRPVVGLHVAGDYTSILGVTAQADAIGTAYARDATGSEHVGDTHTLYCH